MNELQKIIQAACKGFTSFIEKTGSRKFILLLVATHAFYIGILPPEYWIMLAMAWQGVQGTHDIVMASKQPKALPEVPADNWDKNGFAENPTIRGVAGVAL